MSQAVNPNGSLDQNAFLKLMITQMQYQDPLQPQDNSQFLAQLAQFTTLEQMTNIASDEQEAVFTNQLSVEQKLMGQTVSYTTTDQQTVTGTVTGIKVQNGEAQLIVGGTPVSLDSLTEIGGAGNG
jgi:flagellar basal-body rod modification protein FlgD